MTRSICCRLGALALVVGVGWSPASQARGRGAPPVHVLARASIKFTMTSPSFSGLGWSGRNNLMDRGHLLLLGRGVRQEQHLLRFLQLPGGKRLTRAVPSSALGALQLRKVLFYDTRHKQAGLFARQRGPAGRGFFYLHWDLETNRLTRHRLADHRPGSFVGVLPAGYDASLGKHYTVLYRGASRRARRHSGSRGRSPEQPYQVSLLRLGRGGVEVLQQGILLRRLRGATLDLQRKRLLLVEYGEHPYGERPPPQGLLIDLDRPSRQRRFEVPATCYSAAFAAKPRRLLLYGSQRGELWEVDTSSGKRLRSAAVGKRGWALGFAHDGRLLLLNHKALTTLDPRTLRPRRRTPMSRIVSGFSHPEGSFITPRLLVIRNKPELVVLDRF